MFNGCPKLGGVVLVTYCGLGKIVLNVVCHKSKPRQTKHSALDVWWCVEPDVFSQTIGLSFLLHRKCAHSNLKSF
jgi:hypothetical protein